MKTKRTWRGSPLPGRAASGGRGRQSGSLLVEAMITLLILTIGILQFMGSFQSNFRATRDIGVQDQAYAGLDRVVEVLRNATFNTLYSTYQNAHLQVPDLVAAGGTGTAYVLVQFDVNETTLSSLYGPVADLNGDGAKTNTNVSTNYQLLPTHLTLSYHTSHGTETKQLYLILGQH